MRITIIFLLTALPVSSFAQCEAWTPTFKFKIEDASHRETMAWLGGWSAAIETIGANSKELKICTPECGYLISKEMVDILNRKFEGRTISAETAAAEIWPNIKVRLACQKSDSPNNVFNRTR